MCLAGLSSLRPTICPAGPGLYPKTVSSTIDCPGILRSGRRVGTISDPSGGDGRLPRIAGNLDTGHAPGSACLPDHSKWRRCPEQSHVAVRPVGEPVFPAGAAVLFSAFAAA